MYSQPWSPTPSTTAVAPELRTARMVDNQPPARESFADVIVGIAFKRQRDALGQERAKALSGASGEMNADRVVGQSGRAVASRDFAAQHGANGAMDIANWQAERHGSAVFESLLRHFDDFAVKRILQSMVLLDQIAPPDVAGHRRIVQDCGEIDAFGLPVIHVLPLNQAIDAADHLVHGAEAKLRHNAPQVFRHEEEIVDHVLRLARELLTQIRILRGNPNGAGVEMTFAHHDAAHGNQWSGREAKLLCSQ